MMPFTSTQRRLDKLEAELTKHERDYTGATTRMIDKLESVDSHLKEHIQREFEESRTQADKLDDISEKLSSIERDLVTIPKDTDLKISHAQEALKEHAAQIYATRTELNNGLNSIRAQAKWIWTTLATIAISAGWVIERFIK
jgi:chromosome segregation ATPase